MFLNHLQRIPYRLKKVSCRYLKYFSKKIGTKGFLVCALYIKLAIISVFHRNYCKLRYQTLFLTVPLRHMHPQQKKAHKVRKDEQLVS